MATNVTASFVTQWSNEVKQAYQQRRAKLRKAVREVGGITGSTFKFHTMGEVVANQKSARDADVTALNPAQAVATATLADYYAPIYLDKLDALKTNAQLRAEYIKASAAALGRKTDDLIITAADASHTDIATTSGAFTYARFIEVLEKMNVVDAEPEDRFLVVGAHQLSEALAISNLTSADYMSMKGVVTGEVGTALGMQWILSNRLTLGSPSIRNCFGIVKSGLGLAIGQDVHSEISYVPEKVAHLANSYMSMGACVIDAEGVISIECSEA